MRKTEMYALLGMKLENSIKRFHFPTLDTDIFSPKDYSALRNQLYRVSEKNEKLGQLMIRILLKGKIEEIKAKGEALIFGVQFTYKGEQYIVELKLENFTWNFESLQYAGEVPQAQKIGVWAGSAVVALLILLFSALLIIQYFDKTTTDAALPTELITPPSSNLGQEQQAPIHEESIPLSELEEMAQKMDMVLINEEEYQNLLENKETLLEASQQNVMEESPQTVTVTVKYGMTATEVADLLVNSHLDLAENKEELIDFFIQQNIQYRIRTGTHVIPTDATYLDMVHILTTPK